MAKPITLPNLTYPMMKTNFCYEDDLYGDIHISLKGSDTVIKVPVDDIVRFVRLRERKNTEAQLEHMSDEDFVNTVVPAVRGRNR